MSDLKMKLQGKDHTARMVQVRERPPTVTLGTVSSVVPDATLTSFAEADTIQVKRTSTGLLASMTVANFILWVKTWLTKVANLIGGNSTNLKGAIPYQVDVDTTAFVNPNTTSTKMVLCMTGDGANGAAPDWAVPGLPKIMPWPAGWPDGNRCVVISGTDIPTWVPLTLTFTGVATEEGFPIFSSTGVNEGEDRPDIYASFGLFNGQWQLNIENTTNEPIYLSYNKDVFDPTHPNDRYPVNVSLPILLGSGSGPASVLINTVLAGSAVIPHDEGQLWFVGENGHYETYGAISVDPPVWSYLGFTQPTAPITPIAVTYISDSAQAAAVELAAADPRWELVAASLQSTLHASLTIGTGNSAITYEAVEIGNAGTSIQIQHVEIYHYNPTHIMRVGDTIMITPGVPIITTTGTVQAIPDCTPIRYVAIPAVLIYTSDGSDTYAPAPGKAVYFGFSGVWSLQKWDMDSNLVYAATVTSAAERPDYITEEWTLIAGEGQPRPASAAFNSSPFTASGIAAYINYMYPTLVLAKVGGDGSGVIATQLATHLSL